TTRKQTMQSQHLALAERHLVDARSRINRQKKLAAKASADRDLAEDLLSVLCAIERQMVRHRDLIQGADHPRCSSKSIAPLGGVIEAAHYRELGGGVREQALALKSSHIREKLLSIADRYGKIGDCTQPAFAKSKLRAAFLVQDGREVRMNELQQTEKRIVSAYERIKRQRQLLARLSKHRRGAAL